MWANVLTIRRWYIFGSNCITNALVWTKPLPKHKSGVIFWISLESLSSNQWQTTKEICRYKYNIYLFIYLFSWVGGGAWLRQIQHNKYIEWNNMYIFLVFIASLVLKKLSRGHEQTVRRTEWSFLVFTIMVGVHQVW